MNQSPETTNLANEAQAVQARLEALWADEGVEQLAIFLDPDIITVLEEIKQVSMTFIGKVAASDD